MSVCQFGQLISPRGSFQCQDRAIHGGAAQFQKPPCGLDHLSDAQRSGHCSRRRIQGLHTAEFGTLLDNEWHVPVQKQKTRSPSPLLLPSCSSWAVFFSQLQISAQLNWCAPTAIEADRLYQSRAGHMLLRASALNFYSGSSGEERACSQRGGVHCVRFLLEFGATTCQGECNTTWTRCNTWTWTTIYFWTFRLLSARLKKNCVQLLSYSWHLFKSDCRKTFA